MDQDEFKVIGGSVESSLNGTTKLDLNSHVREAWELSKKGKTEVLRGGMLLVCVVMVFVWSLHSIFGVTDMATLSPRAQITMALVFVVVTAPIIAAMLLMGMSRSVGYKPEFMPLLKKALGSLLVLLLALLLAILVDVGGQISSMAGLFFGVAVTLYLGMATGFSMMLLIEKKLSPRDSIIQSFKVFNRHWSTLSAFYIGSMLLFLLGALSFGVAYIWLIPFYFNLKGVLYRELFGIQVKVDNSRNIEEAVFNA